MLLMHVHVSPQAAHRSTPAGSFPAMAAWAQVDRVMDSGAEVVMGPEEWCVWLAREGRAVRVGWKEWEA